ncbi:DedA family protein [bacterium]|nr:DedA family protein [bacterium]
MQEWLIHVSSNHEYTIYFLIIVLASIEGPILAMLFGVLIKLGYFDFLPIYTTLVIGDLIGDSVWYSIGRRFGHRFVGRFGKYFNVDDYKIEKVDKVFHKYKHYILFISKISNGFGLSLVTLITAGMVRIPFWKYLSVNLAGQFIWSGMLIGVGYFFSNLYIQVDTWMSRVGVVVLFVVVVYLFLQYGKYVKKKIV